MSFLQCHVEAWTIQYVNEGDDLQPMKWAGLLLSRPRVYVSNGVMFIIVQLDDIEPLHTDSKTLGLSKWMEVD